MSVSAFYRSVVSLLWIVLGGVLGGLFLLFLLIVWGVGTLIGGR